VVADRLGALFRGRGPPLRLGWLEANSYPYPLTNDQDTLLALITTSFIA